MTKRERVSPDPEAEPLIRDGNLDIEATPTETTGIARQPLPEPHRWAAPILITVIVVMYTAVVQLSSSFENGPNAYRKPLFFSVCSQILYAVFFPGWYLCRGIARMCTGSAEPAFPSFKSDLETSPVSLQRIIVTSVVIAIPYLGVAVFNFLALEFTGVASTSSIVNSSAVFIFFLSVLLLGMKSTIPKVIGVFVCVGGVVLVSFGGRSSTVYPHALLGAHITLIDFFALCCGISITIGLVFQAYLLHSRNMFVIAVYGTSVGIVSLPMAILPYIFDKAGIEPFAWPDADQIVFFFVLLAVIKLLNIICIVGVSTVSPFYVAVGNLLAIPVTALTQYVVARIHDLPASLGAMKLVGIACVCIGFALIEFDWDAMLQKYRGGGEQPYTFSEKGHKDDTFAAGYGGDDGIAADVAVNSINDAA